MALAYRHFGGELSLTSSLKPLLCQAQRARSSARHGSADVLFSLPGTHQFASASDEIIDSNIGTGGQCGGNNGLCGFEIVVSGLPIHI